MLLLPSWVLVESGHSSELALLNWKEYHLRLKCSCPHTWILDDGGSIESSPLSGVGVTSCKRFTLKVFNNTPASDVVESEAFVEELDATLTLYDFVHFRYR